MTQSRLPFPEFQIVPAESLCEPDIWSRRIIFVKAPSVPLKIIRRIAFRRGLNIISTETRTEADTKPVGHSVGKSLLVRVIRYCLGEDRFCTSSLRSAITAKYERVQELLGDKIYKAHEIAYAGELITCGHCGRPITGEIVTKKSTGKQYVYYRCSRYTAPGHPRVRVREQEIEKQLIDFLSKLEQPQPIREWFRAALKARATHDHEQSRARARDVQRQLDDVRRQQDRLLNLHLSGTIDDAAFSGKNTELRDRVAALTLQLQSTDRQRDERAEMAIRVFELSQSLHRKWLTADHPEKRKILDLVCLNLTLNGSTLGISTKKPFNYLVEGLTVSDSGEPETWLERSTRPDHRVLQGQSDLGMTVDEAIPMGIPTPG